MTRDPFATPRQQRHRLKTWPEPFSAVLSGRKTFEWRKDDRDFNEGDWLILEEWFPNRNEESGRYTGRTVTRRIGYVLRGSGFGVPAGWAVLSLLAPPQGKSKARGTGGRVRLGNALVDSQRYRRQPAKGQRVSVVRGGLPTLGKRK